MWQDKMKIYYDQWVGQIILPWFEALDQREQRVVMAAAILVPLLILIFGMVLPMHDTREALRLDVAKIAKQSSDATMFADVLEEKGVKPSLQGSVLSLIDQVSRSQKMKKYITRIRPQASLGGDKIFLIQMRDAPYADSVRFISTLTDKGLGLSQVKFQPSKVSGHVHVQVMVVRGK